MSYAWEIENKKLMLVVLFLIQLLLNISWNPVFFKYHNVSGGLIILVSLSLVIGYMLFEFWPELKFKTILILPYFIWLLVATSLNAYIYFKN